MTLLALIDLALKIGGTIIVGTSVYAVFITLTRMKGAEDDVTHNASHTRLNSDVHSRINHKLL